MKSFHLVIGKTLENSAGVSIASSEIDDVAVVVLGDRDGIAASDLLRARSDEERVLLGQQCAIGFAVLDLRRGTAKVFASPIGFQQIYWAVDGTRLRIGSAPDQLSAR